MTLRDTLSRPPIRLKPEMDPKHAVMRDAFAKMRDAVDMNRRRQVNAVLDAKPVPEPVVDVLRLRSQVAQLSDDDFRALVVSEAQRRGLTGLWRELP